MEDMIHTLGLITMVNKEDRTIRVTHSKVRLDKDQIHRVSAKPFSSMHFLPRGIMHECHEYNPPSVFSGIPE